MNGLLRNLLTLLLGLCRKRSQPGDRLRAGFFVTPLDIGLLKLKSDRYLRLTEAAQIDFLARSGLFMTLVRRRYSFVNAAVLVRFAVPIKVFSWIVIESRVIYHDERFAYLEHRFISRQRPCACVLVKMKFKRARLTIVPRTLLGNAGCLSKPAYLDRWDLLLAQPWT